MDMAILGGIGLLVLVTGILLLRRENRLFKDCIKTFAVVAGYDEYCDSGDKSLTMYTMIAEYTADGRFIRAKEQSGCSSRKYTVGTQINILYSRERPELFKRKGDISRKASMTGMVIVGLAMTALAVLKMSGII